MPSQPPRNDDLVYDWNEIARKGRVIPRGVEFFDETLRDGLQNPSVKDPNIEDKLKLIHLMDSLGIQQADIGLPGSSKRAFDDCLRMCQEIVNHKLKIRVACAGRTVPADITPMIELSQRAGIPVEVYAFVGSSPIRALAEEWDLELIKKRSAEAIDVGVKGGLSVCYVTEDTTRSRPQVLSELFRLAVDHGASRLCLCDTVGHATPDGVRNLIQFTQSLVAGMGAEVGIDWHGHNDRGLGLANAVAAAEAGADRIHGTILGIGERVGNCALDQLLVNFELFGWSHWNLRPLAGLCELVSRATGVAIPESYPVFGRDAYRTQTGVHAAAILKAKAKGHDWLADRVYSGIPAAMVGRRQEVEVGPMSGQANVTCWLLDRGIEAQPELVHAIFRAAKESNAVLSEERLRALCASHAGV